MNPGDPIKYYKWEKRGKGRGKRKRERAGTFEGYQDDKILIRSADGRINAFNMRSIVEIELDLS